MVQGRLANKGVSSGRTPIRIPQFFIVGAPKSGTTALAHTLSQHPEVYIPAEREPQFFGNDLSKESEPDAVPRSLDELLSPNYLRWFKGCNESIMVGEKSVGYLYSKNAAKEIKTFNPSAKIIIQLRNPVDMMHSLHWHMVHHRHVEPIKEFAQALLLEPERMQGSYVPPLLDTPSELYYLDRAKYASQVKRYLDIFGRESVFISTYEEFARVPEKVIARLCSFLNVDWPVDNIDIKRKNRARIHRSIYLYNFIHKRNKLKQVIKALYPSKFNSFARRVVRTMEQLNTKEVARPHLSSRQRQECKKLLMPDILELEELIGIDLSHWK